MARFLLKRFALAIITLFLLSVIAFAAAQLLPGNVGRNVLGGLASPQAVAIYNHQLGVDRPVYVQYADWIAHFVRGDFGQSFQYKVSVQRLLGPALVNSFKLAALAFTITGLSLTAVPEFVSAIVLIVVFGVALKWLPVTAQAPPGSGFFTQLKFLLLPALALTMVLFGYIARMARAGTIEALDADYTRTAVLKGLDNRTVLRKHVLRNSLLPTIAVIATQCGYLIGGLVVIEKVFNYPGIGQRIYTAAQNKDFTMLETGVLIVGIVYLVATLAADTLYSLLNPRIRYGAAE